MDTLLTLPEASQRYHVPLPDLRHHVECGRLWSARFGPEVVVAVDDNGELRRNGVDQGAEIAMLRAQFAHLEGAPIRMIEAAERYQIPHQNVARWAHAGHIRILEQGPKLLVLDEADVAIAAEMYRRRGRAHPGKEVFPRKKRTTNHTTTTTG